MSMKTRFIHSPTLTPKALHLFQKAIQENRRIDGTVIFGRPLGRNDKGTLASPQAVFIAPNGHLTVVHMTKAPVLRDDYRYRQDELNRLVGTKLQTSPNRKVRLCRPNTLQAMTFGPDLVTSDFFDSAYPVANTEDLPEAILLFGYRDTWDLDEETVTNALLAN